MHNPRRRRREPSVRMTAPRMLEVLIKAPQDRARLTLMVDTLEAMQSIVGGAIEVKDLDERHVIVCNEEGRLRGLPGNVLGICGTFIVLGRGDGDAFGSVEDPRAVRGLLAGEDPA